MSRFDLIGGMVRRHQLRTFLKWMRIWKVNTHKKSSGSHVPCEGQAKAHVGFHFGNIGNACGSFQREKDLKNRINLHHLFKLVKKKKPHTLMFMCSIEFTVIYTVAHII